MHWEDRVTKAQYDRIQGAVEEGTRGDALYDVCTATGMTEEEAMEFVNMLEEC